MVGDERLSTEKIELEVEEIYKNFLDEEDEKKKKVRK